MKPIQRVASLALFSLFVSSPTVARADDKAACLEASDAGQAQRDAKKFQQARASFLACAKESCPKVVRDSCEVWAREVTAAQSTVVFRAVDAAGADLVMVKVRVDGKDAQETITGQATPLDPGPHNLTFEHATLGTVEVSIVVVEGQKGRVVSADFKAAKRVAAGASPTTPPPASSAQTEKKAKSPVVTQGDVDSSSTPVPYVVTGVGAVSLVLSGIFYLSYKGYNDDLAKECTADKTCPSSQQGKIDSANKAGTLAALTGVVGVAGVGVGVWMIATSKNTSASAGVTPHGLPFVAYRGSF